MKFIKENLYGLVLLAVMVVLSLYFYPLLPEQIPTKFDLSGSPTQYSSREFVAVLIPSMYFFVIFLVQILIKASPQQFSMPNSRKAMAMTIAGCGFLFLGIHLGMVMDPGGRVLFVRFFSIGTALFLIVVGNVLGKTERNFFVGIRAPWTLASEANWRATHRFGGKMMVVFGLALLALTFFHSSILVTFLALVLPTISPLFYSYLYYRKNEIAAK